jgi:hypothetical protein
MREFDLKEYMAISQKWHKFLVLDSSVAPVSPAPKRTTTYANYPGEHFVATFSPQKQPLPVDFNCVLSI